MTYQIFQILNLSEDQFGDIVKAKMKEALDEARKIEIKRAIKMDKRELEETLQLTRQQVHNWYIKKLIIPIDDSAIKKEFSEEAIRNGFLKLSPAKREHYERLFDEYIERKYRITIK